MTQISLLKDQRLLRKFCDRRNKDYGCVKTFGCTDVCPLAHASETEFLMNIKNLSLGDAMRQAERASFSKEETRKIISDAMEEAAEILRERKEKGE